MQPHNFPTNVKSLLSRYMWFNTDSGNDYKTVYLWVTRVMVEETYQRYRSTLFRFVRFQSRIWCAESNEKRIHGAGFF